MNVLSKSLVVILLLLALNALAYGAFFVIAPVEGLKEFRYEAAPPIDPGALHLISMVGIGFLGFMGFALLAIAWVLQGNRNGLVVSLLLGATYLAIGCYALTSGLWVDALIYGGFGLLLTLLAGLLWKPMTAASDGG